LTAEIKKYLVNPVDNPVSHLSRPRSTRQRRTGQRLSI